MLGALGGRHTEECGGYTDFVRPKSQYGKLMVLGSKGNGKVLKKKISCAKREQKLKRGDKRKAPTDRTFVPIKKRPKKKLRTHLENEVSALKVKFEHLSAENETLSSNTNQLQREMSELRHMSQRKKCAFK